MELGVLRILGTGESSSPLPALAFPSVPSIVPEVVFPAIVDTTSVPRVILRIKLLA
jgi:hypothetical protein